MQRSPLAQTGCLEGALAVRAAHDLLGKLVLCTGINAQAIANSFYGLGQLAQAGRLEGALDGRAAGDLLGKLVLCADIKAQAIANSLYGLGQLAQRGQLEGSTITMTAVQELLTRLFNLQSTVQAVDALQVLFGLAALSSQVACSAGQLTSLFRGALTKSYLHPREVIHLIHYFATFRAHHVALELEFTRLLPAITISLDQCSPKLRQRLLKSIDEVKEVGHWNRLLKERLGIIDAPVIQQEPISHLAQADTDTTTLSLPLKATSLLPIGPKKTTRPPSWGVAERNDLFRLIAQKRFQDLASLLGLSATSAISAVSLVKKSPAKTGFFPTPACLSKSSEAALNTKAIADDLVSHFLNHTDAAALQQLVRESTADYFILLLRACSRHNRYQLCIDNALHPLVLYIDFAQLQALITGFCELELYRDHKALLNLVDALVIRKLENKEERALIQELQRCFIERALAFHEITHHHRVVHSLKAALVHVSHALLLDEDEEEELMASASFLTSGPALVPEGRGLQARLCSSEPPPTSALIRRNSFFLAANTGEGRRDRINVDYQYTSDDIQAILPALLPSTITVLASTDMSAGASGNRVGDVLSSYLASRMRHGLSNHEHHLVMPILINNHWVGIRLLLKRGESSVITYYNSLQQLTDSETMRVLQQEVNQVVSLPFAPAIITPYRACLQQTDGVSCRPYLIENICRDNRAVDAAQDFTTLAIRARHLQTLRPSNSAFYSSFLGQQYLENPLPQPNLS